MFTWIFFVVFDSFTNRSKVIVKSVSIIIGIGFSITIIMGEHTVDALEATVLSFLNMFG